MLHVFECHIAAGYNPNDLLSEETKKETMAQVMTLAEASAVGFSGLPQPTDGREVRLVAVNARDSQWIHRVLEASPMITSYKVHEVG